MDATSSTIRLLNKQLQQPQGTSQNLSLATTMTGGGDVSDLLLQLQQLQLELQEKQHQQGQLQQLLQQQLQLQQQQQQQQQQQVFLQHQIQPSINLEQLQMLLNNQPQQQQQQHATPEPQGNLQLLQRLLENQQQELQQQQAELQIGLEDLQQQVIPLVEEQDPEQQQEQQAGPEQLQQLLLLLQQVQQQQQGHNGAAGFSDASSSQGLSLALASCSTQLQQQELHPSPFSLLQLPHQQAATTAPIGFAAGAGNLNSDVATSGALQPPATFPLSSYSLATAASSPLYGTPEAVAVLPNASFSAFIEGLPGSSPGAACYLGASSADSPGGTLHATTSSSTYGSPGSIAGACAASSAMLSSSPHLQEIFHLQQQQQRMSQARDAAQAAIDELTLKQMQYEQQQQLARPQLQPGQVMLLPQAATASRSRGYPVKAASSLPSVQEDVGSMQRTSSSSTVSAQQQYQHDHMYPMEEGARQHYSPPPPPPPQHRHRPPMRSASCGASRFQQMRPDALVGPSIDDQELICWEEDAEEDWEQGVAHHHVRGGRRSVTRSTTLSAGEFAKARGYGVVREHEVTGERSGPERRASWANYGFADKAARMSSGREFAHHSAASEEGGGVYEGYGPAPPGLVGGKSTRRLSNSSLPVAGSYADSSVGVLGSVGASLSPTAVAALGAAAGDGRSGSLPAPPPPPPPSGSRPPKRVEPPRWAGSFWHPMAEVVKSGQIANGGTGVFIPKSMAAAMAAAADKEKSPARSTDVKSVHPASEAP